MGRNRDFSEEAVLDSVADVFVANGYGGTSIQMLSDATGLGKQSLYNTFGDKRALYLKSVECAVARTREVLPAMQAAPDGKGAIYAFFEYAGNQCASSVPAENACIVSMGLLEGIDDAQIDNLIKQKWAATQTMLKTEIIRGQRDGSIANLAPAQELADFLMSLMSGARVNARAAQTDQAGKVQAKKRIHRVIEHGLRVLDVEAIDVETSDVASAN
jgi:TetR/AcrR family transcriptional regulator, transcriptional repressor for nem operon